MKQDNQKQAIEEMRKDLVEIFDEEYERRRIITADFTAIKMSAKGYCKQSVGEWKWIADDSPMCNICGNVFDTDDNADAGTGLWKFCPNCGARMKGGEE